MPVKIEVNSIKAVFDCNTRKLVINGLRKFEKVKEELSTVKLTPVQLSENDLLFDVI